MTPLDAGFDGAADAPVTESLTLKYIERRSGSPKPVAGVKVWLYATDKEPALFVGDEAGNVVFPGLTLESIRKGFQWVVTYAKGFTAVVNTVGPLLYLKPDGSTRLEAVELLPRLGNEGYVAISGTSTLPDGYFLSIVPNVMGTIYENSFSDWSLKVSPGSAVQLMALAIKNPPPAAGVLFEQEVLRWVKKELPPVTGPVKDVAFDMSIGGEPTTKWAANVMVEGGATGPLGSGVPYILVTAKTPGDLAGIYGVGLGGLYGVVNKVVKRPDGSGFDITGEGIAAKEPVSRYLAQATDGAYSNVYVDGLPDEKVPVTLPAPISTSLPRFALGDTIDLPTVKSAVPGYRSLELRVIRGEDSALKVYSTYPKDTTLTLPKLPDEVLASLPTTMTGYFSSCPSFNADFTRCTSYVSSRTFSVVK